jgi:hypothetical protein
LLSNNFNQNHVRRNLRLLLARLQRLQPIKSDTLSVLPVNVSSASSMVLLDVLHLLPHFKLHKALNVHRLMSRSIDRIVGLVIYRSLSLSCSFFGI